MPREWRAGHWHWHWHWHWLWLWLWLGLGLGNRHGACREALLLAGRQDARPVARLTGPLVGEAACAQRG
ncbi:hypothetical protein PL318_01930 [Burkholderia pseudomallei]|uniref:hypothetical protein n=1 Tax=Burkholderia pseudomallei TaxID=28450 RepID=UPI00097628AD|nr:hypothetical protein [Burkholderia pseudomallei]OND60746.1 hypothetical protein AQ937_11630 [Burkholderia pseudomallei]WCE19957.1 hypothetical protein PL318_01930 [Burkholderia pseudomallei]